jgi:hypothetical protein
MLLPFCHCFLLIYLGFFFPGLDGGHDIIVGVHVMRLPLRLIPFFFHFILRDF